MYRKYFTSNVTFNKICCRAYVDSLFTITYEGHKLNFEGQSGSFLPETSMKKEILKSDLLYILAALNHFRINCDNTLIE